MNVYNRDKALFWMGAKCGIMVALMVVTVVILVFGHSDLLNMPSVVYIYRSLGVLLALIWFWSIDVYIYSSKRINYSFIFELDPRSRLTFLQCFDSAITFSIFYFANLLIFTEVYNHIGWKWSVIWPTALFIFVIIRLIIPLFRHWSSRKFLLNSMFQCIKTIRYTFTCYIISI